MKRLFGSFIAIAALAMLATAPLVAQVAPTRLGALTGIPASITASTTTNVAAAVRLTQGAGIAFTPIFVGSNTVSTAVTYTYQLSPDGTNWSTAASGVSPYIGGAMTRTNAVNGLTSVVGYHLFTPAELIGARYIRLYSIANASANSIITNTAIYYGAPN
jgi:hypothetical protein